jgi:hypothetical protein
LPAAVLRWNGGMAESKKHEITVSVSAQYLPEQSNPAERRFVFAYTIDILNTGTVAAQLISRHWIITDAEDKVQEVRGLGVTAARPWPEFRLHQRLRADHTVWHHARQLSDEHRGWHSLRSTDRRIRTIRAPYAALSRTLAGVQPDRLESQWDCGNKNCFGSMPHFSAVS